MTLKNKSLSIFVLAGIVALSSVAATTMLDFEQTKIQNKETAQNMLIPDGKPYESTVFGGVPMISTYQLSDMHPIDGRAYHLVNEQTDQFVLDAIANGVTLITRDDRIAYNEKYIQSDAKNRFEIKNDDGSSTYYRLNYDEPKIHVTSHYVKLFVYDNNDPYTIKDARTVSSLDAEKFAANLDDAYVWVEVDEQTAADVKNLISENGHTLKIGNTVADVYYFGPFSDDLQRTDIHNMYADKLGVDKIEQ